MVLALPVRRWDVAVVAQRLVGEGRDHKLTGTALDDLGGLIFCQDDVPSSIVTIRNPAWSRRGIEVQEIAGLELDPVRACFELDLLLLRAQRLHPRSNAIDPWDTAGPVGLRKHTLGNIFGVGDTESTAWTLAARFPEDAVRLLTCWFDEATAVAVPRVHPARNALPAAGVGRRLCAAQVDGAVTRARMAVQPARPRVPRRVVEPAERKHVEVLRVRVVDHPWVLRAQHGVNLVAGIQIAADARGEVARRKGKAPLRGVAPVRAHNHAADRVFASDFHVGWIEGQVAWAGALPRHVGGREHRPCAVLD